MTFDLERHRCERVRRLEAENAALRAHRARLERLLASCAVVASASTDVRPADLIWAIEAIDRLVRESPAERAARVLRETVA